MFGDEQTFGKQVGGDIIASKKTCLYLKALSLSEGKQKMELVNLYSSQSLNDTEKVERVKITYNSMNIKEHIDNLINYYYSEAIKSLNSINADLSELELFASLLKKREN